MRGVTRETFETQGRHLTLVHLFWSYSEVLLLPPPSCYRTVVTRLFSQCCYKAVHSVMQQDCSLAVTRLFTHVQSVLSQGCSLMFSQCCHKAVYSCSVSDITRLFTHVQSVTSQGCLLMFSNVTRLFTHIQSVLSQGCLLMFSQCCHKAVYSCSVSAVTRLFTHVQSVTSQGCLLMFSQ